MRKVLSTSVTVQSEAVETVSYDPKSYQLSVTYRSGDTYKYLHVGPSLFQEFLKADSKGRFIVERIKPAYDFRKVEVA